MFSVLKTLMGGGKRQCRRSQSALRQSAFQRSSVELLESKCLLTSLAGRGQDALLVVNPTSESSIRIAAEYQQLRNIPDNNIVFIAPPTDLDFTKLHVSAAQFRNEYVQTIHSAIRERGLFDQIDFIAAVGQPHSFNEGGNHQSLSYGLMQLDQYFAGMTVSAAQSQSSGIARLASATALHHSDTYPNVPGSTTGTQRYYVSGLLAVTEQLGNSTDQVIEALRRSAAADGTSPVGTIYFEDNGNIRAATRRSQWPSAQQQLSSRGIPTLKEFNVSGGTPRNRSDVRGAVVGAASARLPNGSRYLPGSWADNLTSYGARYTTQSQTKATSFIASGAAASSGTVAEPYAIASRFPHAKIFTRIDDGLTLGEAFYQSVADPDLQQFIGDILAQPYGDLPKVTLTGLNDGEVVSGEFSFNASATVPSGGNATAVNRLELYVDGLLQSTVNRSSGQFHIASSQLTDGMHEIRVVAVANNAAESEGIALRDIRVDNNARFIRTNRSTFTGQGMAQISIPITVSDSGSTVQRIELRHLGRVVAEANGNPNAVRLDLSPLAFGENEIIPVAIFADGSDVAGTPFTVTRDPIVLPGKSVPSTSDRIAGLQTDYFPGAGGRSIDSSDFTGTPALSVRHVRSQLQSNTNNNDIKLAVSDVDKLAVRIRGSFDVAAADAGEVLWSSIGSNDSIRLLIDGETVISYDNRANGIGGANASASTFLGPGRHDFEILSAATGANQRMKINVVMRGTNGVTRYLHDGFVYTADSETTIAAPTVTNPVGTVTVARPDIKWTPVDGADNYDVRILNEDAQAVAEATVTDTSFTPPNDLPNGSYSIHVRAKAGDIFSEWATRSFRVERETVQINREIVVQQTSGSTTVVEGGNSDTVSIKLLAAPESNVRVVVSSDVADQLRLSQTSLLFSSGNWNSAQSISVSAIDDSDVDGNHNVRLTFSVASGSDPAWLSIASKVVSVTVVDDDANGGSGGSGGGTTGGSTSQIDERARQIAAKRGLSPGTRDYFNWGGRQERWLRGNSGWYFIVPDGTLFRWDGSPSSRLTGTEVAQLDSRYHADLTLFLSTPSAAPTSQKETLVQLDQTHEFEPQHDYWLNWGGRQEKWLKATATQEWHFITPDGAFYKWMGGGRGNLQGQLVSNLPSIVYEDPTLLIEASAIALDEKQGLQFTGNYYHNWGGRSEKWLRGTNGWYFLTPVGRLFRWNGGQTDSMTGTLEADLGAGYYSEPKRLFDALDNVFNRWAGLN